MGPTFLPIVCFGPTLMVNLPVPSANVNCGVTYTGRATILYVGVGVCECVVCVHVCVGGVCEYVCRGVYVSGVCEERRMNNRVSYTNQLTVVTQSGTRVAESAHQEE